MHWLGSFRSSFFSAWQRAGLPPPEAYEEHYQCELDSIRLPGAFRPADGAAQGPLREPLLESVYAFGVHFGRISGRLLGMSAASVRPRSDWCGRFNLGISLFDYLCDEGEGARRVRSLAAFKPFAGNAAQRRVDGDTTEGLLNRLAAGLLRELEEAVGPPTRRCGPWRALFEMFRAEMIVSELALQTSPDHSEIARALRLKSAEPFRVMSEWIAMGNPPRARPTRTALARRLGRALGGCYWLVDDGNDLWADLEAGRWNLLLLRAEAREPGLLSRRDAAVRDLRLTRILDRSDLVERECEQAIRPFARLLAKTPASQRARRDAAGVVAASLAHWNA